MTNMITQQEVDALWQEYKDILAEHNALEIVRRERDLYDRYLLAKRAFDVQSKAIAKEQKAQHKADSKARFDAVTSKRPLLDLVADESVTGTFEGWQFASQTGIIIKLPRYWREPAVIGCPTWEALRALEQQRGRAGLMGLFVDGYRVTDLVAHSIPVGKVVAWKEEV